MATGPTYLMEVMEDLTLVTEVMEDLTEVTGVMEDLTLVMEATHPTVEATEEAMGDMDMARDLLSLNLVMVTPVMAILATEVMEVMEHLTDLMGIVDTDTIK